MNSFALPAWEEASGGMLLNAGGAARQLAARRAERGVRASCKRPSRRHCCRRRWRGIALLFLRFAAAAAASASRRASKTERPSFARGLLARP